MGNFLGGGERGQFADLRGGLGKKEQDGVFEGGVGGGWGGG